VWRQIPWVAQGLTLQGAFELFGGLALFVVGTDSDTRPPTTDYERWLFAAGPPLLLVGGAVKAFAAMRNRRFRGRRLGIVALWSAVPTAVAWPCAPSGLALLVYGSIVYRDRVSREAFALGESGKSPEEVVGTLRRQSQGPV
jgi:hypothetical protein